MPNHNDSETTVAFLKSVLLQFREERDWLQFHTPKDLAASLAIEAGELQELFLWKPDSLIEEKLKDPAFATKVRHEVADVVMCLMSLANRLDLDLTEVLLEKMAIARAKYPIEKSHGNATKYNEL